MVDYVEIPKKVLTKIQTVEPKYQVICLDIILKTWYKNKKKIKIDDISGTRKSVCQLSDIGLFNITDDLIIMKSPIDFLSKKGIEDKELDKLFDNLIEFWNTRGGLMKHNRITLTKKKKRIVTFIKEIGMENLQKAIQNYNDILISPDYFFTYSWGLIDFLERGLDKFLENNKPKWNYLNKDIKSQRIKAKSSAKRRFNEI